MVAKLSNSRSMFLMLVIFSMISPQFHLVSSDNHHSSSSILEKFIHCLSHELQPNNSVLESLLHFPSNNSSSYESIWESRIENIRFLKTSSFDRKKPLAIITPESYSQIQNIVRCCRQSGLRIRSRSGGHDYEGSSYVSSFSNNSPPFVMVDLRKNLRSLEQGAIDLIHKWQEVAHKAHEDLLLSVVLSSSGGSTVAQTTATFRSLFLGRADDLVKMMEEIFPEIGLRKQDCEEMSWIESILRFSSFPKGVTIDALKDGVPPLPPLYFKGKVDLVYKPIPCEALEELWKRCSSSGTTTTVTPPIMHFELHPYGGKMDEISKSETPFPHRKGVLYEILYIVAWLDQGENNANGESYMNWLRRLYEFMAPFVSTEPRGAIVNVRDFDLGINVEDYDDNDHHISTYSKAYKTWGSRYFGKNFRRLAIVKGEVDPENFFFFEQSIPPL
ncbi:OLC1v1024684C1 [Oldenlandia corymbosa var. corymbosa]|uniref:OLC1v1024684C1 n=1 Tax=Oldenlandia corymbosa var. corymbosa TaxID=529605 RepID=A0AAV1C5S8_OLDCO|nr:OLC1v1024684C1 [Oldenlandia corymbosa var. corymbosa]